MPKPSKFTLCLILVSVFIITVSCAILPKSVQQIFTSPTPTSTNTPTATPTSTSTPTATSTPMLPFFVKSCYQVGVCPDADWVDDLIEDGVSSGEVYTVSFPYDREERFLVGWSAATGAILMENLEHISWIFRVDGQDYFTEDLLSSWDFVGEPDPDLVDPGMWMDITLSGWKLNQTHTIEIGYIVTSDINDGYYDYEEGYNSLYTYIVSPSDLPTATPTPTVTNTPKPLPTAIPYTKTPKPTLAPTNPPCNIDSSIEIDNTTGGFLSIDLTGPMKFHFDLATGHTSMKVCPGSYSYKAWGCGGASDSGTLNSGESHEFYCY